MYAQRVVHTRTYTCIERVEVTRNAVSRLDSYPPKTHSYALIVLSHSNTSNTRLRFFASLDLRLVLESHTHNNKHEKQQTVFTTSHLYIDSCRYSIRRITHNNLVTHVLLRHLISTQPSGGAGKTAIADTTTAISSATTRSILFMIAISLCLSYVLLLLSNSRVYRICCLLPLSFSF